MKTRPISEEMQRALAYAELQGGRLHRHPGGFWGHADWFGMVGRWFGASTISSLVNRGLAQYTKWQRGKRGSFPIEVTRIEQP